MFVAGHLVFGIIFWAAAWGYVAYARGSDRDQPVRRALCIVMALVMFLMGLAHFWLAFFFPSTPI